VISEQPAPVGRLLRPRSVAIVGVSPKPGSLGGTVLTNLENFNYHGAIYLVSRGRTEVLGKRCSATIDELPSGIDVAVLCVPRSAALDTLAACARREVGAAIVFASGFAEADGDGVATQNELARIARVAGLALLGPNCLGLTNYLAGVPLGMGLTTPPVSELKPALGLVSQSGAMLWALDSAFQAKGVGLTHAISTGNEAILGAEDFVANLIEEEQTRAIAVLIEQVRRPQLFLELARRARQYRKPVVLFHPGRSRRAREAARSHTGAIAGDHATMKALVEHAAVLLVDSVEELIDVSALLSRYPEPPTAGVGVLTNSGAFRGIAIDLCEEVGLDVPALAPATIDALKRVLPAFAAPDNPLDVTAQLLQEPGLLGSAAKALLEDDCVGSLVISVVPGTASQVIDKARAAVPFLRQMTKPVAFAVMGDDAPLPVEFLKELRDANILLFRSPERALRAIARLTSYGRTLRRPRAHARPLNNPPVRLPATGTLAEYQAKTYLRAFGIRVPAGAVAKNPGEAHQIASRIGFPVVLKAQGSELTHKTDVGGVIVGIENEKALRQAWSELQASIGRARPTLKLEGVLVEKMGRPGLEMAVGARRDPAWGPVLWCGSGGVWIEVLKDTRLLPPGLAEDQILEEIFKLRAAPLLRGFRGAPAMDVRAVAKTIDLLGHLIRTVPELSEIEINPLLVYPEGQGVLALDALIIASHAPSIHSEPGRARIRP
jgi:acetate---CoA ligase (ADP-forming)